MSNRVANHDPCLGWPVNAAFSLSALSSMRASAEDKYHGYFCDLPSALTICVNAKMQRFSL
jgi:hypothetical protein